MHEIHPKVLKDDQQRPIAVQIEYSDWLEIQQLLGLASNHVPKVDVNRFGGTLRWTEDAVDFQRRVRSEWES